VPAPHLDFPFRVEGGKVATVEQNSRAEVRNCVIACLRTRRDSLIDFPDYGIPNELFSRQPRRPDAGAVLRAVEEAEPRASLLPTAEVEDLVRRYVFKEG
jgi:hypothetical protein